MLDGVLIAYFLICLVLAWVLIAYCLVSPDA